MVTKRLLLEKNFVQKQNFKYRPKCFWYISSYVKKMRIVPIRRFFMVTGSLEQYNDDFNAKDENGEISG